MILGFLGKGGSGKSSVATQMTLFSQTQAKNVLAIDADHNMDLSYNLTKGEMRNVPYFSHSLDKLQASVGLSNTQKYADAFLQEIAYRFTLDPLSPEIEQYSTVLAPNLRLMTAGPQTDEVLFGQKCSHSLATPLKILLPLLQLQTHEVAIIDEKAGADGVSTGIVTGVDVGVIICEPSLHSVKAAKQIAALMDFYDTPYMFVGNKVNSIEDKDFIAHGLEGSPKIYMMETRTVRQDPSKSIPEWTDALTAILQTAEEISKNDRLERTVKKFKRNHEFLHAT